MAIGRIPKFIRSHYEIHEWKHACAILSQDFPSEWEDIVDALSRFRLLRSDVVRPGGRLSPISVKFNTMFAERGWVERGFDTKMVVDENEIKSPTHKVDCYKNRVAIEIEQNSKDLFLGRDANNCQIFSGSVSSAPV